MMPFSILKNNYLFSLIDAIILCIDYFPKSNGMDHIGNNLYIIIKIINIITFKNKMYGHLTFSSVLIMFSTVRPCFLSFSIAAKVTWSFV